MTDHHAQPPRFLEPEEAFALAEVRCYEHHHAVAVLQKQIFEVACDIRQLEEAMSTLIESGADNASLEKPLHLFSALITLRMNKMLQGSAAHPEESAVIKALQELCIKVDAIKSRPDIRRLYLGDVQRSLWASLGKVSLFQGEMHLAEYDGEQHPVTHELIESIASVCSELVIDPARRCPQEGFARGVPPEEIAELLSCKGSRLFVLEHKGKVVGFYIFLTDRASVPEDVEETFRLYEREFGKLPPNAGFLSIVGILPEARHSEDQKGIYAYPFMASAVAQSAYYEHLAVLLGEVRAGSNANLARPKHLAVGLRSTGLTRFHGDNEYEVLSLDPSLADFYAPTEVLKEAGQWHGICAFDNFPSYKTVLDQLNYRDPASVTTREICALNGSTDDAISYLDRNLAREAQTTTLRYSTGFKFQIKHGSSRYTIRQLIPNQDMWTCDFAEDRHQIYSFREAVDHLNSKIAGNV